MLRSASCRSSVSADPPRLAAFGTPPRKGLTYAEDEQTPSLEGCPAGAGWVYGVDFRYSNRVAQVLSIILAVLVAFAASACSSAGRLPAAPAASPGPGTPEDRAALFDYLVETTFAREALSPIKNERLGLDIEASMRQYRDELLAADTDEKLFYALIKISNARRDRHLGVSPAEGGIWPSSWGPLPDSLEAPSTMEAPIRFAVDYSTPGAYFVFVADFAANLSASLHEVERAVGHKLVAVNDQPFDAYLAALKPYIRHSTVEGFWWKFAERISERHYRVPPSFYRAQVTYTLERADGSRYTLTLPYLDPDSIVWAEHGTPQYPGFRMMHDWQTFDFYVHEDKPVIVLDWYGFREDLVADVDSLVADAEEHDLLDHAVIIDATRSRGGSRGSYAVQRLSPKPFKTTFGNLRLSDVTEAFVEGKRVSYAAGNISDGTVPETMDGGAWQMAWLEGSVLPGLRDGQNYSNNVAFKLAHAPAYSDGVLRPTPVHFRGPLVVFLGPHGGSHLDQFASIVADNQLGHIIGMPAGGYSNTWEWEETLVFPISKQPVAAYMWSIGHTIRPNGEILEGNPAQVDDFVPQTAENYGRYRDLLVERALRHLGLD